jgi:hypothetical protein
MTTSTALLLSERQKLSFCKDTIKLYKGLQTGFITLAKRLKEIRDKRLHEPQWESFSEFCVDMGDFSASKASRLITIVEKFLEAGVSEELVQDAGWGKLVVVFPVVTDAASAQHWAEQASLLTRTDLVREVAEVTTGIKSEHCKHPNFQVLHMCTDCHFKTIMNLDQIEDKVRASMKNLYGQPKKLY